VSAGVHGNTHEVSQVAAPDSKVVYVDNDPIHSVVLTHEGGRLPRTGLE
jgi:hypothetical protein